MDMMGEVLETHGNLDFAFGSIVQAEIVEVWGNQAEILEFGEKSVILS